MTINYSDNFRDKYAIERDSESASDWWNSRYDDEWVSDGPAMALHPCPVSANSMCGRGTCEECKWPVIMHKDPRRDEWEIT